MQLFLRLIAWVFSAFVGRTRAEGAKEERAKIETDNAAHIERQNKVASKPVSDDQLRKSLKDGSF